MHNVCHQIEEFCGVNFVNSDEHVDARTSRIVRDNSDVEKVYSRFAQNDPFSDREELISLSSGILGTTDINCQEAFQVGLKMLSNVIGSTFDSLPLKRKDTISSLSDVNSSLLVANKRVTIDPLLLFQRMCISSVNNDSLEEHLSYELTPFPLSLFTEEGMRKTAKSSLYDSFSTVESPEMSLSDHLYVIDGGFLLHKVVRRGCCVVNEIFDKIKKYINNYYKSRVHIVFDGYPDVELAGTKSAERLRRSTKHLAPTVQFDENTSLSLAQEKFLSNDKNKARFIELLVNFLRQNNITAEQAFEDADNTIVETAILNSRQHRTVIIVGEDIDLLVLLTELGRMNDNIFLQKPAKGKQKEVFYSTTSFKAGPQVAGHILLLHAFTGCDTTSSLFGIGKGKLVKILKDRKDLQACANNFRQAVQPANNYELRDTVVHSRLRW